MRRIPLFLFFAFLLLASCLSNPATDDEQSDPGDTTVIKPKKKLTITPQNLKLIPYTPVDFKLTIEPPGEPGEMLLWEMTYPEGEEVMLLPYWFTERDDKEFPLGESTVKVSLVDSLESLVLGINAPHYGSASTTVSVKNITLKLQVAAGPDPYHISCSASSPERDYFPEGYEFTWTFGDDDTLGGNTSDAVTHDYEAPGEYTIVVFLSGYQNGIKRILAGDSTTVVLAPDPGRELKIEISPRDTTGSTASELTYTILPSRDDIPGNFRWKVDYGDGKIEEFERRITLHTVGHRYEQTGDYVFDVSIYDLNTNVLLAQDSAIAHITNLPFIRETNYLSAKIEGFSVRHFGTLAANGAFIQESETPNYYNFGGGVSEPLVWTGNTFKARHIYIVGTQTTTVTLTGWISQNASEIERLEYSYDFTDTDHEGKIWTRLTRIVLERVPLTINSPYDYSNSESGGRIGSYVTDFEDWTKELDPLSGTATYIFMDEIHWNDASHGEPGITVKFEKR